MSRGYPSAVMIHWTLKILAAVLVTSISAQAQLATSLRMAKNQHLAGEPVIAIVTVTNHAGKELVFASDGRFQWLDFVLKDSSGGPVTPRRSSMFGAIKIAPGQTLAREVDLSQSFQLSEPGNFSVSAVIHAPGKSVESSTTNRVFFNQSSGRLYWSQKVGLRGGTKNTRDLRILNFSGDSKSQIYAQVADGSSGQLIRTFLLGDCLMLRKPIATVDRDQRMHVMFLATPAMWVHCVVNTDGKLVARQIHQRTSQGDPQLLTFPDGSVRIANSIPYDPKAAAAERAKTHKASDRPAGPF